MDLINGDCLEEMKKIQNNSVNLILTDPPYNINHNNLEWDKIDNYIDFMISVFKEGYRILKKNGCLYFFHNDFKQIAKLQVEIEKQTKFRFQRFITITKDSYINKLYPNSKSWINCCEYLLIYTKHENREVKQIDYFKEIQKQIGKKKTEIIRDIPLLDHALRISINNFSLPTQETYDKMIELYNLKNCKTLEELRTLREPILYTYNGKSKPNYIHANFKKKKLTNHPCEKPQEILQNLIQTASNEGDTILDCFMGCGSTGLACKLLNRKFIGIEKDTEREEEIKNII